MSGCEKKCVLKEMNEIRKEILMNYLAIEVIIVLVILSILAILIIPLVVDAWDLKKIENQKVEKSAVFLECSN